MNDCSDSAGYHISVPSRDGAYTARLSPSFVDSWSGWFSDCFEYANEYLGPDFNSVLPETGYWNFVLPPGTCDDRAWAGVMRPFVGDGRSFLQTICLPIASFTSPITLALDSSAWFEHAGRLLRGLDGEAFQPTVFDEAICELGTPVVNSDSNDRDDVTQLAAIPDHHAWRFEWSDKTTLEETLSSLEEVILNKLLSTHTLWWTAGVEANDLLVCDRLPDKDKFLAFLDGKWRTHGWNVLEPHTRTTDTDDSTVLEHPTLKGDKLWTSCALTDMGRVRSRNEDACVELPEQGIWAVADGMGGHADGDLASQLIMTRLSELAVCDDLEGMTRAVTGKISLANRELFERSAINSAGMTGATIVALLGMNHECVCLWAGDSRIYRHRNGMLEQITRDHNLAEELVQQQLISPEEASSHPSSNRLTRAVGIMHELNLDSCRLDVKSGDSFLLCSDGLNKEVSDAEIETMMAFGSTADICEALINLALQRGARDNVTALVVSLTAG